jgi:hypothetical protein
VHNHGPEKSALQGASRAPLALLLGTWEKYRSGLAIVLNIETFDDQPKSSAYFFVMCTFYCFQKYSANYPATIHTRMDACKSALQID